MRVWIPGAAVIRPYWRQFVEGAVLRVRPKVMTVAVIIAGLLPILWGGGAGSG